MGYTKVVTGQLSLAMAASKRTAAHYNDPKPVDSMSVRDIVQLGLNNARSSMLASRIGNARFAVADSLTQIIDASNRIRDLLFESHKLAQESSGNAYTDGATGTRTTMLQPTFEDLRTQINRIALDTENAAQTALLNAGAVIQVVVGRDAANHCVAVPARELRPDQAAGAMGADLTAAGNQVDSQVNATTAVGVLETAINGVTNVISRMKAAQEELNARADMLQVQKDEVDDKISELNTPDLSALSATMSELVQRMQVIQSLFNSDAALKQSQTTTAASLLRS